MNSWYLPGVIALTVLAVIWDLAKRRIPNAITLTGMAMGLAGHAVMDGGRGLAWSAGGLAVGFGLLLVPVLMGGMGAGDLKLMGAVGALVGPGLALEIALVSGVVGGLLALAVALRGRVLRAALERAAQLCVPWRRNGEKQAGEHGNSGASEIDRPRAGDLGSVPYGVAIGVGTWICVLGKGAW